MSQPAAALIVIYARDIKRVARFYECTLSLAPREEEDGFIVLGNEAYEVAVVRMAGEAKVVAAGSAPLRTHAAVKGSFFVADLEQTRAAAEACGGTTRPVSSAWRWRDQLHLDGGDPEGNVVQFRTGAA